MARFATFRSRLICLFALATFPAVALALALSWHVYRTANLASDRAYRQSAVSVAMQAQAVVQSTRRIASTLLAAAGPSLKQPDCAGRLAEVVRLNPQFSGMALLTKGGMRCSAGQTGPLTAFSREALLRPLAAPAVAPATADQDGTILVSKSSGGAQIAIASKASADAVLAILIDPKWFRQVIAEANPIDQGTVAIIDETTSVVMSSGRDAPSEGWLPLDTLALQNAGDMPRLFQAQSRNNRRFIYAMEPIDNGGIVALAGFPRRSFGPAERQLAIGLVFPLILFVIVLGVAWVAIDRLFLHWIRRLDDTARRLAFGDFSVRAVLPQDAPLELRQYAHAFDQMTQVLGTRTHELATVAQQRSALLRELHHRVKNNFQVIASFLTLMKREHSGETRNALSFAESRVHAMAAAYKLALAQGDIRMVSVHLVIDDVVAYVQQSASLPSNTIALSQDETDAFVDLDHAIPLALLLVEVLWPLIVAPPASREGLAVHVSVHPDKAERIALVIRAPARGERPKASRFQQAFLDQLDAEPLDMSGEADGPGAILAVSIAAQPASSVG